MVYYRSDTCFKHSRQWRSRVEWLSNKLRIKLKDALLRQGIKMEEFVTTFRNLLCVCDEDGKKKPHLKEINDEIWRTVSEDDLRNSVEAVKSYAQDMEMKRIIDNLMKLLYGTHAISEQGSEQDVKCAYRVTYIMQKLIWNDFSLIKKYVEELEKRRPKLLEFELEEISVENFDNFIGPESDVLERFSQEHSCKVTLKKIQRYDDSTVIKVLIKKVVDDVAALNEIKSQLVQQLLNQMTPERETEVQMEVNYNISATQNAQTVEPQQANNTQPFVPQTTPMQHLPSSQAPTHTEQSQQEAQSNSGLVSISAQNEPQSNSCLVHSLQWMSTYQFILNQCISRDMLSGTRGYDFSEKICSCRNYQEDMDMSLYFMSELDIQEKIGKVKDELKSWRNGLIVMHKFIKELEKVQTVGTWHSLLKFVHHFLELKNATGNGTSQSVSGNR